MAVSTVSDLNDLFNKIYEDAIFVARESNIMTNLVTNYSAKGWMARKLGIYPELTASTVAEGVDYSNPTTFDKTVTMTLTPGEIICQVILTDRRIETDPDNARRDAAQEMGNAIATKIDSDLVGLFSGFSTDKGPGAGQTATIAKFAAAVSVLRFNKVPNPIYAVVHPYHWHPRCGAPAA